MGNNGLDTSRLPDHLAIILDGNGRWTKQRGKSRSYGHRAGVNAVENIVEETFDLGIKFLSLYVFSVDNWKRDKKEVSFLMKLIKNFYKSSFQKIKKNGIKVLHSGIYPPLPEKTIEILKKVEEETKNNTKGTLNLCINYGGRVEIVEGIKKLYKDIQNKKFDINNLTSENFSKYLFHPTVPDVDLLIRTSNEIRISDFQLWRISYSELWFTDTLWPDFSKAELHKALKHYQSRERRFGGIK